jgi:hypothetical protein
MAIFDNIVTANENFKGYTGNPPTTEAEYTALDCWKDVSLAPTWASIAAEMVVLEVLVNRKEAYPSLTDQADMQYWDSVNGTTTWADAITAVKEAHPKP